MTKERAQELWPIIKAYGEGKTIQFKMDKAENKWTDIDNPEFRHYEYRIKPEPRKFQLAIHKTTNKIEEVHYLNQSSDEWEIINVIEVL